MSRLSYAEIELTDLDCVELPSNSNIIGALGRYRLRTVGSLAAVLRNYESSFGTWTRRPSALTSNPQLIGAKIGLLWREIASNDADTHTEELNQVIYIHLDYSASAIYLVLSKNNSRPVSRSAGFHYCIRKFSVHAIPFNPAGITVIYSLQPPSTQVTLMPQLRDDGSDIYTKGSNTPTPGDNNPQSMDPTTNPAAEEVAFSAPAPSAEKKRTPSRASSLLSTLAPPFNRRLGRASSVTKANGKLAVDLHDALRNTPSKESNLTTASQSIGEETSPTEEGTPEPRANFNGDQRANGLERADTVVASPARNGNGDLTKSMKRLSRRVSDAGARKVNSAIGSLKRRMGLGHSAGEEASTTISGTNAEVPTLTFDPAIRARRRSQSINPDTLVPPKEDSGHGFGRTPSIRDKWKRGKGPATDTFEFATTFSSSMNGNTRQSESTMVDSPTAYCEADTDGRKSSSGNSNRPLLHHTTSTPLRFSISPEQKGTLESSPTAGALDDISVPQQWRTGTEMNKVSHKGTKRTKVILDPDQGFVLWKSKKSGIIRIENITELRPGSHAKYNMEQLNHSEADQDRWLTITYLADEKYKALHLVALTSEDFKSFYETLGRLRALRIAMLSLPSDPHLPPTQPLEPQQTNHSNGTVEANGVDPIKSPPKLSKLFPVHSIHKHLTNEQRQNLWERHYWKGADVSVDGRVDLEEIKRMAHKLSIDVLSHDLEAIFKEIHHSGGAGLNLEEFRTFWRRLRTRADIQIIWNRITGDNKLTLTFEGFEGFMRMEQKDTRGTKELERVFTHYASNISDAGANSGDTNEPESMALLLTLEGFAAYLMSLDNAPFSDQNLGVYHDMSRPLSEYYISSSHNTYLVGHQLVGESTTEGYIRALLNSCRCVEIDIYDGDKEPVITHGGTLTSKIPLRVICEAIEKHAFVTSPYPVIISAEVHCGVIQQHLIAEIMMEVFKDKLVVERMDGTKPSEPLKQLPSPQMLMNRILLKTKNPTLAQDNAIETINTESAGPAILAETDGGTSTGFTSDPEPMIPERRSSFSLTRGRRGSKSHALTPVKPILVLPADKDATGDSLDGSNLQGPRSPTFPKTKIFSQALADLLVYTVGVKCRGINKKEHYAVEHMFSLSEKKMDKMLKEGSIYYPGVEEPDHSNADGGISGGMLDLIKHTQTHLVRTYPKGTRLKSTNYIPHRYWAAGAQLVAINWQTSDLGSMINQAMFLRNGKSGYVLKPASLRPSEHKIKDIVTRRRKYTLEVTIISAQQLPRPRDKDGRDKVDKSTMDPYVQVALYVPDWPGVPKSTSSQADKELLTGQSTSLPKSSPLRRSMDYKPASSSSRYVLQSASTPAKVIRVETGAVKNNGFNPSWQTCLKLNFEVTGEMLDLVFIRFSVRDEGDTEDERALAMYCTSLGSLKQGHRHLPLHDQQMTQYLFSTLFIHTNLREINA